jgi:hypothetical protein
MNLKFIFSSLPIFALRLTRTPSLARGLGTASLDFSPDKSSSAVQIPSWCKLQLFNHTQLIYNPHLYLCRGRDLNPYDLAVAGT